ncbi:DNA-directed RNA polymerase sigma-70 factor [Parapedobacter defluvii]|uniref:DNA-directed RNA polymerase sigma-70 factor n=1 Tax=Parapedobacter defluvii TaxID=2045106 RepID=A0ABQ1LFN7_9SPHI|nr:RNA polymerase sigma-70 factor [Parapedobacter defluvii]GGC22049.1 DNA-directed RNA polymerase sigma-70 factor [Parapedobacter defluvii]
MHIQDEKRLLLALSNGNREAFDTLFRNFFPKLSRFLRGMLDDEAAADDLAQDIFVKLWQNRDLFAHIENLDAYLFTAAKNALYNHIKRKAKTDFLPLSNAVEVPSLEQLEEVLSAHDLEVLIDQTIEKMPPKRKTVFNLSRKEGLSNEKIAHYLHISKRTVETHISAALADIRKAIRLFIFFF